MFTICPSNVSLPTRSARMTKLPVPLTVPPVTLSPTDLFHRERLAGDHRLLDVGAAFQDHAVHGHLVTGNHAQLVADLHLVERDFLIAARSNFVGPSAVQD